MHFRGGGNRGRIPGVKRSFPWVSRVLVISAVSLAGLALFGGALGCSGSAVVEPSEQSGKRAKAFLAKCSVEAPADGTEVEMVYACLPAEDACPDKGDDATVAELNYILHKGSNCGTSTEVYDVPCGPDLNAIECCYAVRMYTTEAACD